MRVQANDNLNVLCCSCRVGIGSAYSSRRWRATVVQVAERQLSLMPGYGRFTLDMNPRRHCYPAAAVFSGADVFGGTALPT